MQMPEPNALACITLLDVTCHIHPPPPLHPQTDTPCCSLMAALCRVSASKLRTAELEICYRLNWSFARILSTTGTIGDPITDDFPALFAGG